MESQGLGSTAYQTRESNMRRGFTLIQVIVLAVIVTVLVAFDFKDLVSRRNLDILLLLAPSLFLLDPLVTQP